VETIGKIVENVDVLVGNEEDLQMGLGIPGPEVAAKSKLDRACSSHDGEGNKEAAERQGGGHDAARSSLHQPAQLERGGVGRRKTYQAPMAELDVVDRVGGGDGFAAGFIYDC